MSQIIEIRYERVKNLGKYETERLSYTAVVNGDESAYEVFVKTKNEVLLALKLIEETEK